MDVQLYHDLVQGLLDRHFNKTLSEARVSDERLLYLARENKLRPYQVAQAIAFAQGLTRTDLGPVGPHPLLEPADELATLADVRPVHLLDEDPAQCTKCGTRTAFDEITGDTLTKLERSLGFELVSPQYHQCPRCRFEFVAEFDCVAHQTV
jgi:hypothetical protein